LLAQLLGLPQAKITPGRMSYDLRRLRLHGIIERVPHTQRYRLTDFGLKTALFYSRLYQRLIRPGLSLLHAAPSHSPLAEAFAMLENAIDVFATDPIAA
jgi:hypothetical protein